MKTILVLLLVCATALAAPQTLITGEIHERSMQPANVTEDVALDDDGNFSVRFVSEDGTTVQEQGILVEDPSTGAFRVTVQKGYYYYTGEDGKQVELVYDANNPGQIVI